MTPENDGEFLKIPAETPQINLNGASVTPITLAVIASQLESKGSVYVRHAAVPYDGVSGAAAFMWGKFWEQWQQFQKFLETVK